MSCSVKMKKGKNFYGIHVIRKSTVNEVKIGRSHVRTAECELCII